MLKYFQSIKYFLLRSIPAWLAWIRFISWFYYGYSALMINQWSGVENIACQANSTASCIKTGRDVLEKLNIDEVREGCCITTLHCLHSVENISHISVQLCPGHSPVGPAGCCPQDRGLPRPLLESKEEILTFIIINLLNNKYLIHSIIVFL